MTAAETLSALRSRGIEVWTTPDGGLKYRGPSTAATADLVAHLRKNKAALVKILREPGPDGWPAIEACRRRAESVEDLAEIWAATVEEIALRWKANGQERWLREERDLRLQQQIADAIRQGDRGRALVSVEQWRDAWLRVLRQPDLESSARLGVIAMYREGQQRYVSPPGEEVKE